MERYPEALADFDRAIELDPKYTWAIARRGVTYRGMERYPEALADFDRAIELDPKDNWLHYNRALAHIGLKQPENAKADLTQALQLAKYNYDKNPNNHRNTFNLGLYYLVARQPEKAKLLYQNALTREAPTGIVKEAIQDLKDLLIILPNYPNVQEMQGFLESALSLRQPSPQP
jgi:tetratricopeptide (TPR) repeat protein